MEERRGGTGDGREEDREESEEAVGCAHGVCMYGDAGKRELFGDGEGGGELSKEVRWMSQGPVVAV